MELSNKGFRSTRSSSWSRERIEQLGSQEIEQLRINAGSLGEEEIVARCDEALRGRPKGRSKAGAKPAKAARRLISRAKAFETRGVHLDDARSSWGGVRRSDGAVVLSLWADEIKSRDGACNYLLWAPNLNGSRPWSDTAAGKERRGHCKLAVERGGAEGLLVHGELLDGYIPEDKARSVHGVDPETLVRFQVERHGEEYWAVWGKKQLI